jgi:hypothetical protein
MRHLFGGEVLGGCHDSKMSRGYDVFHHNDPGGAAVKSSELVYRGLNNEAGYLLVGVVVFSGFLS